MGSSSVGRCVVLCVLAIVIISFFTGSVLAQGIQQSPYRAPASVRSGSNPFDLGPSNPLAAPMGGLVGPRENDSILLSPGMFQGILPNIPNFKAGYLYSFGDSVESGRLSLDLVQPVMLGNSSAFFGEFHNEWRDFWKTVTRGANHRVDLSVGGGYRTIFNDNTLVGVNAFYDTTRLGSIWYSSGGVGAEFAALLPGNDAIDLAFNWYGNLFNSDVLANAFRRGPQNYDFQAGYSQQLWNGGPDLRLSATGYRFSAGDGVYGYRGAAELKSPDGMLSLKYEAAHDRVNETYHTVGGFVNVGLQLENLLAGESPFVLPDPIFSSPRNFARRLKEPVDRRYHQPGSVVVSSRMDEDEDPCASPDCISGGVWTAGVSRLHGGIPDYTHSTTHRVTITWRNIRNGSSNAIFQFVTSSPAPQSLCGPGGDLLSGWSTPFNMSSENGSRTLDIPFTSCWSSSDPNEIFYFVTADDIDLTDGCICFTFGP